MDCFKAVAIFVCALICSFGISISSANAQVGIKSSTTHVPGVGTKKKVSVNKPNGSKVRAWGYNKADGTKVRTRMRTNGKGNYQALGVKKYPNGTIKIKGGKR